MGNITISVKKVSYMSAGKVIVADLTFSNSYATNGDVLPSNGALGLNASLDSVILCSNANGYNLQVDHANRKIKAFQGDNANAAAAPGIEVPNTTNLSAVSVRAVIHGDMAYTA